MRCPRCQRPELYRLEEHPGGYTLIYSCGLALELDRKYRLYKPEVLVGDNAVEGQRRDSWPPGLAGMRIWLWGFAPQGRWMRGGHFHWQAEPPVPLPVVIYHARRTRSGPRRHIVAVEVPGYRELLEGDLSRIRNLASAAFSEVYPEGNRTHTWDIWPEGGYILGLTED